MKCWVLNIVLVAACHAAIGTVAGALTWWVIVMKSGTERDIDYICECATD
jgi:hypothetical protein